MTAYLPACVHCRNNAPLYFKACLGCQARRAKAMDTWHTKPGMGPLPAPSVDKPKGGER